MNRYVLEGMIADAVQGARVVCVGAPNGEVLEALGELREIARVYDFDIDEARRNGEAAVSFDGGGLLVFRSPLEGLRGELADVVVAVGYHRLSDQERGALAENATAAGATRPQGCELIKA